MVRTLDDGDRVLLKPYGWFRRSRTADVACIRRRDGPMLAKRVGDHDSQGRFGLSGDGAASARAIDLGYASDRKIVGRVLFRLSESRIRLIRRR